MMLMSPAIMSSVAAKNARPIPCIPLLLNSIRAHGVVTRERVHTSVRRNASSRLGDRNRLAREAPIVVRGHSVAGGERVDRDGERKDERGVLAGCDVDAIG